MIKTSILDNPISDGKLICGHSNLTLTVPSFPRRHRRAEGALCTPSSARTCHALGCSFFSSSGCSLRNKSVYFKGLQNSSVTQALSPSFSSFRSFQGKHPKKRCDPRSGFFSNKCSSCDRFFDTRFASTTSEHAPASSNFSTSSG